MRKTLLFVLAAAAAGFAWHALAQSRFDVRPAVAPIGTSSSNGVSFAWFYDAAERTVFVCRTSGAEAVDCKARAQLP